MPVPGAQVPESRVRFWDGPSAPWCVVVPVINEGERLLRLVERMHETGVFSQADVIVVDGGSTDGSTEPERLRRLGVRGVLEKTGPGRLGAQLRVAYAFGLAEGYPGVVTIDGNDKDDPEGIGRVIEALAAGNDLVQASRFIAGGRAENTPVGRWLAIRAVHAPLLRVKSGFPWSDTTQGFRGYSRKLLLHPEIAPFRDVFSGYELLPYLSARAPRLGLRCVEVPSTRRYPRGNVPTRIRGVGGHVEVLSALVGACLGSFDPSG